LSVRKIPIQNRSVSGRFYSQKNQQLLDFESQLEKKHYLLLEFDNDVISYIPQPLKVEKYIPDILAQRKDDIPLLIEVKYSSEVENADEKLLNKIKVLEKYCSKNNLEFKIATEKEIINPYFDNISLIYNYSNINIDDNIKSLIIGNIPKSGITIMELLEKLNNNSYLMYIYHLVFNKVLDINLYQKLNNNSIVRLINA